MLLFIMQSCFFGNSKHDAKYPFKKKKQDLLSKFIKLANYLLPSNSMVSFFWFFFNATIINKKTQTVLPYCP